MSRMAHGFWPTAIASIFLVLASTPPAARASTQYSGRAIGAEVHVAVPLPGARIYADTGALAAAGGTVNASLTSITDALFTCGPVSCVAQGSGDLSSCTSAMTNLSAFAGTAAALSCSSVRADASAACAGSTGSSTISGLVFAGVSVVVTGAANQIVSVPGVATLVINEQVRAAGAVNMTVNALHLTLVNGNELIICSSHSDIASCETPARSETWGKVKMLYR
jgi:hypothetical protein